MRLPSKQEIHLRNEFIIIFQSQIVIYKCIILSFIAETVPCSQVPTVLNASVERLTENKVSVSCETDFSEPIVEELECENGTWSESKINCTTNKQQDGFSNSPDTNSGKPSR